MSGARRRQLGLVALMAASSVVVAQEPPATAPVQEPVAVARGALVELDQLSVVGAKGERVLEVMQKGLAAIEEGKKAIPGDAPATAAAKGRNATAPAGPSAGRVMGCQLEFMQGEMLRRGAAGLAKDNPVRAGLVEKALSTYRGMRLEYRDVAAGVLGYVGEARVKRMEGDLAGADEVLAGVAVNLEDKNIAQLGAGTLAMQRVVWLERVETALARDQGEGEKLAERVKVSALMAEASAGEKAHLRWAAGQGDVNVIRDADVTAVVPEYQRLGALAKVAGVTMTPGEELAWGRLQAWGGMGEAAVARYAAAREVMGARDWLNYGLLLHSLGKYREAVRALEQAKSKWDTGDSLVVLRGLADARLRVARGVGASDEEKKAAAGALWELAGAANDVALRREALRSWVYVADQTVAAGQRVTMLQTYVDEVKADPYLYAYYARDVWRENPSAEAKKEIRENVERLLASSPEGEAAVSLVYIEAVAARAESGARGAMEVLRKRETALGAEGAKRLAGLKVTLMVEMGLVDEAVAMAGQIPPAEWPAGVGTRLAGRVAQRYAAGSGDQKASVRAKVVELVGKELSRQHAGDVAGYRQAAREGAKVMIDVEAYADARGILEGLRSDKDPETALLLARALNGEGKLDEAKGVLDAAVTGAPDAGEVYLARAEFQQQLRQWEESAGSYREARRRLDAGGESWWRATLGLVEVLQRGGHGGAGKEILRVASAMYRAGAPASLVSRIDSVSDSLNGR